MNSYRKKRLKHKKLISGALKTKLHDNILKFTKGNENEVFTNFFTAHESYLLCESKKGLKN